MQVLEQTDIAVLVIDGVKGMSEADGDLIKLFEQKKLPFIKAFNKSDGIETIPSAEKNEIYVSAKTGDGIFELKEMIGKAAGLRKTTAVLWPTLWSQTTSSCLWFPLIRRRPKEG